MNPQKSYTIGLRVTSRMASDVAVAAAERELQVPELIRQVLSAWLRDPSIVVVGMPPLREAA